MLQNVVNYLGKGNTEILSTNKGSYDFSYQQEDCRSDPVKVQSDWLAADTQSPAFIRNKPNIVPQIQSDWNQNDDTEPDFIKNKPEIDNQKWENIQDKPDVYPPIIGKTSVTAKAGDYVPDWSEITNKPTGQEVNWEDVKNKPDTFPPVIGTTAKDAKAGNYSPTWAEITDKPTTFTPPLASPNAIGGVKQMASIADIAAAPTQEDFNGLLAALRAAGMLASTTTAKTK